MPSKDKGGCGGFRRRGGKVEKKRQIQQEAMERRIGVIDKKALAKADKNICPSERKAKEKREMTRQEKQKQQQVENSPKETRASGLEQKKQSGRHNGKARSVPTKLR
mmetsp:Transcript_37618/g.42980  ORF Transcript_37618/g.42980 Transcript_37618/m.42980 type:complete len:107 (-) Transcript_37618:157-477(-)